MAHKTGIKLAYPSYGNELMKNIKSLQYNDELCDFTVSAEGKSLKVTFGLF